MDTYTDKSAATHSSVVETTFLLCKPEARHAHREVLQLVADANFRVQAKTFTATPAAAEILARTFPCVREQERLEAAAAAVAATTPSGTHAGLTLADGNTTHPTSNDITRAGRADVNTAPAAQQLLAAHTQHLVGGGRLLAVALTANNAVNRLLAMVGPVDPTDARRVAPHSLRALYGGDSVVHNAIHAAMNLSDAAVCIRTVFGYDVAATGGGTRSAAAAAAAVAAAAAATTTMAPSALAMAVEGMAGDSMRGPAAMSAAAVAMAAPVPRPHREAMALPAMGPVALARPEFLPSYVGFVMNGPVGGGRRRLSSLPPLAHISPAGAGMTTPVPAEASMACSGTPDDQEARRAAEVNAFLQYAAAQRAQAETEAEVDGTDSAASAIETGREELGA